jgi:hypothetical protein
MIQMDVTWPAAWQFIRDLFAVVGLPWAIFNTFMARKERRRNNSPRLVFGDERIDAQYPSQYGFITRNIGLGSAVNVDIPPEFLLKYSLFLGAWKQIRRELAPGGVTKCLESNQPVLPHMPHLEMTYEDIEGHKCRTIYQDGRFEFRC